MKLDMNKTHNKIIVLFLIGVPILTIGFLFTYWTQNKAEAEVVKTQPILEESVQETDSSEKEDTKQEPTKEKPGVSQEDIDASKIAAEKFAQAYSNYDASNPLEYVENTKPYMTKRFAYDWSIEPPRRPLALAKSTVKLTETYPMEMKSPYEIGWNVIITSDQVNPLGDIVTLEEWFWILMDQEDGEWKVKEVDITNG